MSIVLRLPHAPEPLGIKAVIFDLDGLLVDSEGLAADAWRRTLASYGATVSEEEIQAMFGMRIVDDAALLIERHRLPTSSETLVAQRNDIMRTLLRASLQPMPGAVDLVRRLSEHNVPLALATSAQRWYAEECLAAIGVDALFAVCVTGDDVTNGKPDPEVFLAAAARLGVAPSSCLVLEDAPLGVAAAIAANMPVIAVPNAFTRGLAFPPGVASAGSLPEVSSWLTLG